MSKKFSSDLFHQQPGQEPTFQIVWNDLQPKTYTSSFQKTLKDLETKLLKQSREKALLIEKESYEKGFAQGEKDGFEVGQRRLETVIRQFENILLEMERQRSDLCRTHEKEMLQLVLSISKKLLHDELPFHEEGIRATLQEAFQHVVDRKRVIVHLHPMDYQYLLNHPEGFPFLHEEEKGVKVIEDSTITRGGCFLETSFGEIDATLESQFDEIVSLIWKRFESSRPLSDRSKT